MVGSVSNTCAGVKNADEPDLEVIVVVAVVVVQISAGESWNLPSVIWLRRAAATHAFVHSA